MKQETNRNDAADGMGDEEKRGRMPWIYTQEIPQGANEIEVASFRQILIWPLTLRMPSSRGKRDTDGMTNASEVLREIRALLRKSKWEPVDDLLDHLPIPAGATPGDRAMHDAQGYAEFVYFHDFVQGLIFGRAESAGPPPLENVTLFRRADIRKVEFEVSNRRFLADVERCNLYLFNSGAAVLALEWNFDDKPKVADLRSNAEANEPRRMTLADVQTFTDHARRSYAPYFSVSEKRCTTPEVTPAKVPGKVRWLDDKKNPISFDLYGATISEFSPGSFRDDFAVVHEHRVAPVAPHWRVLLDPLVFAGYAKADAPAWRQVVDERIPVMSYVSLTGAAKERYRRHDDNKERQRKDLRIVKRGDWIRLCYADEQGDNELPYSPSFLRNFERDACYDRFFPSRTTDSSARFLIAGFHFAVVGAGWFFDTLLVHHFRRHYFQMGLMLHMEFAGLLATSSRITEAVRDYNKDAGKPGERDADGAFGETIIAIERDFLKFMHLFHFTGLSNQIQANELFLKWRRALGIDQMFADVRDEIEAATKFVLALEQREETKQQGRQSLATSRLTSVATIGAVLGLAFSFLGMNLLIDKGLLGLEGSCTDTWRQLAKHVAWVTGVVAAFAWGGFWVARRLREGERKNAERVDAPSPARDTTGAPGKDVDGATGMLHIIATVTSIVFAVALLLSIFASP